MSRIELIDKDTDGERYELFQYDIEKIGTKYLCLDEINREFFGRIVGRFKLFVCSFVWRRNTWFCVRLF